ncbi:MAG: hypothetical protein IV100_15755, partial [Myxococcales bacterium]|nr:hypothetical protein [Myxococcales bacterium]
MSHETNPEMSPEEQDRVRAAVRDQYGSVARAKTASSCAPGCCGPSPDASLALGYSQDDV